MNAQQFLKSKGESYPERVRFHTAGSTISLPLEDLLNEFAQLSHDRVVVVESPHHKGAKPAQTKPAARESLPTSKKKK